MEEFNRKEVNMEIGTEVVGKFYEGNGGSPAKCPCGTERSGSPSTKYPTTEEGD